MNAGSPNQDHEKVRRQVGKFIEELIQFEWLSLRSTPDINVDPRESDGGTDAITLAASAQIKLFVKHDPDAVIKEFAGHDALSKGPDSFTTHLVPPLSVNRQQFWVALHVDGTSLHSLAMEQALPQDQRWITNVYRDVLTSMKELWTSTRTEGSAPDITSLYYTSRFVNRLQRWKDGFRADNLYGLEIVVNGVSRGTYGDFMMKFSQRVAAAAQHLPRAHCVVHGDEHANNILVQREKAFYDPHAWLVVDYVNATTQGDWAFSIAKMLYWWRFFCVIEHAKRDQDLRKRLQGTWETKDNRLLLTYEPDVLKAAVPAICGRMEAAAMQLAQAVGQEFGETPAHWKERLRLAQIAAIWGAAANHFPKHDFAVPIMMAEALNLLYGNHQAQTQRA